MIEVILEAHAVLKQYLYMHARTVKEFHIHIVKKITSNQKLKIFFFFN